MQRRELLGIAAGGVVSVTGCVAAPRSERDGVAGIEESPARLGYPPEVCTKDAMEDPGIYAVTDPAFASDWRQGVPERYRTDGPGLSEGQTVVGVGADPPRAYPISVLWYHEVVNDRVTADGRERPVIVTYCPLCSSGLVAERAVNGQVATFRVSGLLWIPPELRSRAAEADGDVFGATRTDPERRIRNQGNLVMVDSVTGSYWSQLIARGICGSAAGDRLPLVPATVTTWGDWRRMNPDGEVLLPPPASATTADR